MKFEAPKVLSTLKDNELGVMLFDIFELDETGCKLLKRLHELYVDSVIFPANENIIGQFGSAEVYCGFKSGQANVIKWIEFQIKLIKDERK